MPDSRSYVPDPTNTLTLEWIVRQLWRISAQLGTGWNADGNTATSSDPLVINGELVIDSTSSSTTPLSTLDVIGSLGLAYEHIDAQPAGSRTLTADDDVYRFTIDIDDLSSPGDVYTLVLPLISTVDRRVYEIKITDVLNGSDASAYVDIDPNANDYFEDYNNAGNGHGYRKNNPGDPLPLQVGDSVTIYADATDSTWWVT